MLSKITATDIERLNELGRPLTRLLLGLVCAVIGISIGAAFVGWGFFHATIPEIPAQNLLAPALPFAYQAYDNWVRQHGKNVAMRENYQSGQFQRGGAEQP